MLLLLILFVAIARSQFTNPARFRREKWVAGEVEDVEFDTDLEDYTIAIWQQSLSQGAASKGPVIYQTTDGGSGSFKWPVQIYDFELEDSNVFFLWLFEGSASQQGNTSATQMSSSFFNITEAESSTTKPVESTTAPSQSSATSQIETTSAQATLTEVLDPTGTDSPQDLDPSSLPTTTTGRESQDKDSEDLSVAAKSGIGAGVGIAGITCICCTVLLWRYLRKKKAAMGAPHELASNPASTYGQGQTPPPYWKQYPMHEIQGSTPQYGSQYSSGPVELGPGRF